MLRATTEVLMIPEITITIAIGIILLAASSLAVRQAREARTAAASLRELLHDRLELLEVGAQLELVEPGWSARDSESHVLRQLLIELSALRAGAEISRDRLVMRDLGGAWERRDGVWVWRDYGADGGSALKGGDVLLAVGETELDGRQETGGTLWRLFRSVHGHLAASRAVVRRSSSWVVVDLGGTA